MRSLLLASCTLLLTTFLLACSQAQQAEPSAQESTREADEEAIRVLIQEYAAAFSAGDVARLLACYTEDAVRMPPAAPAYTGRAAFEEGFRKKFEQFSYQLTWPAEEIVMAAGWAFHQRTYISKLTPVAGGEVIEGSGKAVAILQKQPDNSWKIAREIWNSDSPGASQAENNPNQAVGQGAVVKGGSTQ